MSRLLERQLGSHESVWTRRNVFLYKGFIPPDINLRRYQIPGVELYWWRLLSEDRARLNDHFIIQSIPVGDDSLNRAWWFIMGVITQSFSPKSTTWLPTRYQETHGRGQTVRDKEGTRYCQSQGSTHTHTGAGDKRAGATPTWRRSKDDTRGGEEKWREATNV